MKSLVLLFSLAAFLQASAADMLKVGDTLPSFAAKDQHERSFELKPGIRVLLVAFDMSTRKKANAALAAKGPDFLEQKKAVYLSNIHGMPAIGRMFALPKMRKYPHRIILADDEKLLSGYPVEKDRVTVLALDPNLRITGIGFWNPASPFPAELTN